MEERVLKSTLPLKIKEKVLKDIKIIVGAITKEMERKIANSPVDSTIGEVAIQELVQGFKQKGSVYQKLLAEDKKQQEKIDSFKEKSKKCKECQKYCDSHEKQTQKVMVEHEKCKHCHKYDKQIQQTKEEVEKTKERLEKLKKNKPGAAKEIQKLTAAWAEKKKLSEKLRHEALGNRTKCPILNKLKAERKACSKCQEQQKRKYRAKVENPLQKVCLIDKGKNPEVYLLTNTNVC